MLDLRARELRHSETESLSKGVADRVHRVQRGVRILEDALHDPPCASSIGILESTVVTHVETIEHDATPGGGRQSEDATRQRGLPGPGLTDDTECLTTTQHQIDTGQCGMLVGARPVGLGKLRDGNERWAGLDHASLAASGLGGLPKFVANLVVAHAGRPLIRPDREEFGT